MITENENLINTKRDLKSRSSAKVDVSSTTRYGTTTGYTSISRSGRSSVSKCRTEEGGSWWRTEDGEDTGLTVLLQVMFPFLMAGVGMVGAGFVFDFIVSWPVFVEIKEIIIMIPATRSWTTSPGPSTSTTTTKLQTSQQLLFYKVKLPFLEADF